MHQHMERNYFCDTFMTESRSLKNDAIRDNFSSLLNGTYELWSKRLHLHIAYTYIC